MINIITNLNEIFTKPNYRCLSLTDYSYHGKHSYNCKFLNYNTVYHFNYKIIYVVKNNPWKNLQYDIRIEKLLSI